ncbi:hypothetical protein VTK73DRAFT_1492 [Phialemonium thermophilum]|uniref:Uncharacterized protein n=1 Tax=Phialemonium thermophilum TaxID=223376 RepID=A0ABR3X958_9PEZI
MVNRLEACSIDTATCHTVPTTTTSFRGCIFFLVAFSVLVPVNLLTGVRYNTPLYSSAVVAGLLLEILAYVARVLARSTRLGPDDGSAYFIMYMLGVNLGPALLTWAAFLCLSHIVGIYGKQFARAFRPLYLILFFAASCIFTLSFEAVGISFQAKGIAQGTYLLIAGLALQIGSTLVFYVVYWSLGYRLRHRTYDLDSKYSHIYLSARFRVFVLGIQLAAAFILAGFSAEYRPDSETESRAELDLYLAAAEQALTHADHALETAIRLSPKPTSNWRVPLPRSSAASLSRCQSRGFQLYTSMLRAKAQLFRGHCLRRLGRWRAAHAAYVAAAIFPPFAADHGPEGLETLTQDCARKALTAAEDIKQRGFTKDLDELQKLLVKCQEKREAHQRWNGNAGNYLYREELSIYAEMVTKLQKQTKNGKKAEKEKDEEALDKKEEGQEQADHTPWAAVTGVTDRGIQTEHDSYSRSNLRSLSYPYGSTNDSQDVSTGHRHSFCQEPSHAGLQLLQEKLETLHEQVAASLEVRRNLVQALPMLPLTESVDTEAGGLHHPPAAVKEVKDGIDSDGHGSEGNNKSDKKAENEKYGLNPSAIAAQIDMLKCNLEVMRKDYAVIVQELRNRDIMLAKLCEGLGQTQADIKEKTPGLSSENLETASQRQLDGPVMAGAPEAEAPHRDYDGLDYKPEIVPTGLPLPINLNKDRSHLQDQDPDSPVSGAEAVVTRSTRRPAPEIRTWSSWIPTFVASLVFVTVFFDGTVLSNILMEGYEYYSWSGMYHVFVLRSWWMAMISICSLYYLLSSLQPPKDAVRLWLRRRRAVFLEMRRT